MSKSSIFTFHGRISTFFDKIEHFFWKIKFSIIDRIHAKNYLDLSKVGPIMTNEKCIVFFTPSMTSPASFRTYYTLYLKAFR